MKNKRIKIILAAVITLLLIPFIAMQFTDEVKWTLFDFVIMATALLSVGFIYELVARKSDLPAGKTGNKLYRIAFAIGLLGAFLLFWVNGAVGIIGNEGQDANLMYGAVFIVGFFGSLIARFNSRGMARTMFAAAFTQMLVPVVSLFIWPPPVISWAPSVFGVFVLTAFFAMLFAVSGSLFQRVSLKEKLIPNQ